MILDTEMFRHFDIEFNEAKKMAKMYGVDIALYLGYEFIHIETHEFYEKCINNDIRNVISNVPSLSMEFKRMRLGSQRLLDDEKVQC